MVKIHHTLLVGLSPLLATLPLALGVTPAGRWGHQAVYVPSQAAMYVIGGQVSVNNNQITNDVLVLPLNNSNPSFTYGMNDGLPPHAFAAMAITPDSSSLVIAGGMTGSCSSDGLVHTMDLGSGEWSSTSPNRVIRRRGAEMAWVDSGTPKGAMMLVGGIADKYSCSSITAAYSASDVLSLPMTTSSLVSSRNLPAALTGTNLAVADYALASKNGTTYLIGGQSSSGSLVPLTTVGVWTKEKGWVSQSTSGDIPTGRVGATLAAHPAMNHLLLFGGSESSTGTDSPTSLVALLDTDTWAWSHPANLQPYAASASSYHTAVMTPSGVMITAFGLSSSGTPRSDVNYLDMRSSTMSAWTWKTTWTNDMLSTTTANEVAAGPSSGSAPSKSKVVSIAVPIIVVLLLGLPVLVYFVRRKMRILKKQRMARHFSFSSQEDEGDFHASSGRNGGSGDDGRGWYRKTMTQYSFGKDANEKEGNLITDITGGLKGILKRYTSRSTSGSVADGEMSEKEMSQISPSTRLTKLPAKSVKWEEIDFGLGKLDESRRMSASRRSSFSATGSPPDQTKGPMEIVTDPYERSAMATDSGYIDELPLLVPNLVDDFSPRVGSPLHDGQLPLIPSFALHPPSNQSSPGVMSTNLPEYPAMVPMPTANPFVDPAHTNAATGPRHGINVYSTLPNDQSTYTPAAAVAPPAPRGDSLNWNMLEQELSERPAFRSISPTSPLRSHQHQPSPSSPLVTMPSPAPAPVSATSPRVPRVAVPTYSSPYYPAFTVDSPNPELVSASPPQLPAIEGLESFSRTITLVNPKTGRRTSETLPLARTPSPASRLPHIDTARRASLPIRGFVPGPISPSSSGSTTPTQSYSPGPGPGSGPRRSSNPMLVPAATPASPAVGGGGKRRVSAIKLRVVNPDEEVVEEEELTGTAI